MSEAKQVHLRVKCPCCKETVVISFAGNIIKALGIEVEKFDKDKWKG